MAFDKLRPSGRDYTPPSNRSKTITHPFQLVDVFGTGPFTGNPLGVVAAAEDIDTEQMQAITRWLNLSETVFLLPPSDVQADYRVRIFTLERELPFAGHPTLGACHAWLSWGGAPKRMGRIVQECGAGLVSIRTDEAGLAFEAPALLRDGPVDAAELEEIIRFLRIDPAEVVDARWADNGPGWVALLLRSAEAVLAVDPERHYPRRMDVGIVGPWPAGSETAFELRTFFSDHHGTIVEDPVTGSFNASAAQWLLRSGRVKAPWLAAQGTRVGRSGRIRIDEDEDGTLWIGGRTETLFSGETAI